MFVVVAFPPKTKKKKFAVYSSVVVITIGVFTFYYKNKTNEIVFLAITVPFDCS